LGFFPYSQLLWKYYIYTKLLAINPLWHIGCAKLSLRPSPGHQLLQLSFKLSFKRSLDVGEP
jgi:hypothetical protein